MKISEVEYEGTRNQKISEEQFFNNINLVRTAITTALQGHVIYRGEETKSSDLLFVEPAKFKRYSANTANYYTEIIDNSEKWKSFPKRGQSLICTTDYETAYGYGPMYVVLPVSDPVIGVCAKGDFWYGFDYMEKQCKLDPPGFNSVIACMYHEFINTNWTSRPPYQEIVDAFQQIDSLNPYWKNGKRIVTDKNTMFSGCGMWKDEAANKILQAGPNLLATCEDLLDPDKNGFNICKLSQIESTIQYASREVWLSAPSFMVPLQIWAKWQGDGKLEAAS